MYTVTIPMRTPSLNEYIEEKGTNDMTEIWKPIKRIWKIL